VSEIRKTLLPVEAGELVSPREPGLGVQVDESMIERYLAVTADHSVKWSSPG
jgi:L-alanine-DL-glutamate epimerase-like enolase superfamily enzyme